MEIFYLDNVPSTQKYLLEYLKTNFKEVCFWTNNQTDGIGTRGRNWIGMRGNLFFSFSFRKRADIPNQSYSLFFAYLLKSLLNDLGSDVKLKWPNDLYLNKKVGGVLSHLKKEFVVCGIGLNTILSPTGFDKLDIKIDEVELLTLFFRKLETSWSEVFDGYKDEFYKHKFITSDNIDLSKVVLQNDGSIKVNGEVRWV